MRKATMAMKEDHIWWGRTSARRNTPCPEYSPSAQFGVRLPYIEDQDNLLYLAPP